MLPYKNHETEIDGIFP